MSDRAISVYDLKALAAAVERRDGARTLPGAPCPQRIAFFHGDAELTGYGNNPQLLEAIKREIRISWEELRARAFVRLEDEVRQLSAKVLPTLSDPPRPAPSPRETVEV